MLAGITVVARDIDQSTSLQSCLCPDYVNAYVGNIMLGKRDN